MCGGQTEFLQILLQIFGVTSRVVNSFFAKKLEQPFETDPQADWAIATQTRKRLPEKIAFQIRKLADRQHQHFALNMRTVLLLSDTQRHRGFSALGIWLCDQQLAVVPDCNL